MSFLLSFELFLFFWVLLFETFTDSYSVWYKPAYTNRYIIYTYNSTHNIPNQNLILLAEIQIFSFLFFVIREIFVVFGVNLNKLFKTREKSETNKQSGGEGVEGFLKGLHWHKGRQTNRMKCAKRQFLITNSPQHLTRFCCLPKGQGRRGGGVGDCRRGKDIRAHTWIISIWGTTHTHTHTPFGQTVQTVRHQKVPRGGAGAEAEGVSGWGRKENEKKSRNSAGLEKAQLAAFYADPCQATKHT